MAVLVAQLSFDYLKGPGMNIGTAVFDRLNYFARHVAGIVLVVAAYGLRLVVMLYLVSTQ